MVSRLSSSGYQEHVEQQTGFGDFSRPRRLRVTFAAAGHWHSTGEWLGCWQVLWKQDSEAQHANYFVKKTWELYVFYTFKQRVLLETRPFDIISRVANAWSHIWIIWQLWPKSTWLWLLSFDMWRIHSNDEVWIWRISRWNTCGCHLF